MNFKVSETKNLIYTKCCSKFYKNIYDHNQENNHKIKKRNITKIKCDECNRIQDISNKCINCNIQFSDYFCKSCKFFSNKKLYHCKKCKKCYIDDGQNYIHCDKCNTCYNEKVYNKHNCEISCNQCQICFENFKEKNEPYYYLDCHHKIHVSCYKEYKKHCINNNKIINCTICRKSINKKKDNIRFDNIVNENIGYNNVCSKILCYDCYGESETNGHYKYLKCFECNSYNTNKIT